MAHGRHTTRYLRPRVWRARWYARGMLPLVLLAGAPTSASPQRQPSSAGRAHPSVTWRPDPSSDGMDRIRRDRASAVALGRANAERIAEEARRERARRRALAAQRAAAEQRRKALARQKAAEARRRAAEATRRPPGVVSAGQSVGTNSTKAAAVLARARSLLGRPYCRGGEGSCLDCSGFTLLAYRAVGLNLPHYSGDQPRYGRRVGNPLPGDLAWRPGHVAIVYSGSQLIGARRPGVLSSIYSNYGGFTYFRMW
jgi:cell wall-associated NlpC family hydrolase